MFTIFCFSIKKLSGKLSTSFVLKSRLARPEISYVNTSCYRISFFPNKIPNLDYLSEQFFLETMDSKPAIGVIATIRRKDYTLYCVNLTHMFLNSKFLAWLNKRYDTIQT